jgi:hypothetical protein
LELQGQVFLESQVRGEGVKAFVRLSSVYEPYSAHTWSDRKGRFKFSDLPPGIYSLSVSHPKGAEEQKTIEVTPSFANAQGIVTMTITLRRVDASRSTSSSPRNTNPPKFPLPLALDLLPSDDGLAAA